MSSPITIPRSATSSKTSSSPASSPGLYVPVHKRSGSSSSRASSPSSPHFPALNERPHSRIYSAEFLLSLRPNADESVKDKMREACPEAVMNRRTRKNLEFTQHQRQFMERKAQHHQPSSSPVATPISFSTPFSASTTASTMPPRIMPRRNRPAVRATERRRQALQPNFNLHETWRGRIATPLQPLAVV